MKTIKEILSWVLPVIIGLAVALIIRQCFFTVAACRQMLHLIDLLFIALCLLDREPRIGVLAGIRPGERQLCDLFSGRHAVHGNITKRYLSGFSLVGEILRASNDIL